MSAEANRIVQKLWSYCTVLRDDGLSYGDYLEQLSVLDLNEFVSLYKAGAIEQRQPTWSETTPEGRWRSFELEELLARDKISLDLFWLKDESLLDSDNLPDPDEIAAGIADDLRSALEQMEEILGDLEPALADPLP